ncbi:MAG: hemolysin family protein, partial [Propionibacterium sp.]|nr:hemolysin family protein [Propionibacterium sp.]
MPIWGSIAVIFVLFFIGGVFSAAEMALVSLRDAQIEQLSTRGKRGRAVKELTSNPNRFLSAVQIGVTLAGFLSSAFGTDSLAGAWVAPAFARWGVAPGLAGVLAVIVVTALISFFSIVISELFSKRLALQRPETMALVLAPIVNGLAKVFRPVIWALGASTNALVRLVGFDPKAGKEGVGDEELRSMVVNAHSLGAEEKHIVDEVFSAGDRSLREVMVPRTEVDFLPGNMTVDQAIREVQGAPHSRYPVIDGSPDRVLGFLHVRDLMGVGSTPRNTPISKLVRPVLSLPETVRVPRALSDMRRAHSHLAIVLDEYGGTAGVVTLEDLVEELIGDITDEYDVVDDDTRKHRQLSEIDGLTTL